jgi:hypothetical protein
VARFEVAERIPLPEIARAHKPQNIRCGPGGLSSSLNEHPPFSAIVGTVADDLGQDHSARDQPYQFLWTTELSDGTIFLRPLHPGDAADHLAGENDAMAKWLSGKVSGAAKNIANIGGFRRCH